MLYQKIIDGVLYEQNAGPDETARVAELIAQGWSSEDAVVTGTSGGISAAQVSGTTSAGTTMPQQPVAPPQASYAGPVGVGQQVQFSLNGQSCSASFTDASSALAWLGQVSGGAVTLADIHLVGNLSGAAG